jgi:hypothetical protein
MGLVQFIRQEILIIGISNILSPEACTQYQAITNLPVAIFKLLHHSFTSNKQRRTPVQFSGYLFKDPLMAICGPATCYFYYVSQRITFIEQP